MSSSNPKVRDFATNNRIRKSENVDIYPPFGRKQVIDFLDFIKHPKADYLRSVDAKIADIRNNSILIHGYSPRIKDVHELKSIFNSLIEQLRPTAAEEWQSKLDTALFMNKFQDTTL